MGSCGMNQAIQDDKAREEEQRLTSHLGRIRHKFLVMSGKGGVGKSSVATFLAVTLSKRCFQTGLMDVDLHGPSIPRMLGIHGLLGATENGLTPKAWNSHLKVVSMECLLEDPDSAVIWRGPVKAGVIRQFVSDVEWGDLDMLVIDSPPGTGDEPLSVAQTIPDASAIIVTTPQEVALADVRKSINFCRQVGMPILGLIENMSGLVCPHCGVEIPLLGQGGGLATAKQMDVPFLGRLPFDPRVVQLGDEGRMFFGDGDDTPFALALGKLVDEVVARSGATKPAAGSCCCAGH